MRCAAPCWRMCRARTPCHEAGAVRSRSHADSFSTAAWPGRSTWCARARWSRPRSSATSTSSPARPARWTFMPAHLRQHAGGLQRLMEARSARFQRDGGAPPRPGHARPGRAASRAGRPVRDRHRHLALGGPNPSPAASASSTWWPEGDAQGRPGPEIDGSPCFREHKITKVEAWLTGLGAPPLRLKASWFYSLDSASDLPLLVGRAPPGRGAPRCPFACTCSGRRLAGDRFLLKALQVGRHFCR